MSTAATPRLSRTITFDRSVDWAGLTDLASKWATRNEFSMPRTSRPRSGIQVIDLFCGAGGLSAGFEMLGRRTGACAIVGAADLDPSSAETYEANIGVQPVCEDLGVTATDSAAFERLLAHIRLDVDRPTIVIGGPPCQGFTAHRKRLWSTSDIRNELVATFGSIALRLNPEIVVMENVPELLSEKYWRYFQDYKKMMESAGYHVSAQIHNLASYGVAQERFRSLIIAARTPLGAPAAILERSKFRTVRQEIGHLPNVSPGQVCATDPMHRSSLHKPSTIRVIEQVAKDGGSRPKGVGPASADRVDGFRDVYGRLSWDRPSVTITGYARNPASGRFVHPEQNRGLTLREAALLQGFPRNYTFQGPGDSRFQQVGNAVPARFSLVLAAHVIRHLADPHYRESALPGLTEPARNSFSSSLPGLKGSGTL